MAHSKSMRVENEVWNRSCKGVIGTSAAQLPGDRALCDMITFHGVAMNGGLLHAVESFTAGEIRSAVNGFRYFELDAVASVIEDVVTRWAADENRTLEQEAALERDADERYAEVVTADQDLVEAFEARYAAEPSAFAQLSDEDIRSNAEVASALDDIAKRLNSKYRRGATLMDNDDVG